MREPQQINPVDFAPPDATAKQEQQESVSGQQQQPEQKNRLILIGGLVLAALLVVIAPTFFNSGSDIPTEQVVNQDTSDVQSANETAQTDEQPLDSPWTDAQLAKARAESQDVLAELLALQKDLEYVAVTEWASGPYQELLDVAASGDVHYQNRSFNTALAEYAKAVTLGEIIQSQIPEKALEYRRSGLDHLTENQSESALNDFQLSERLDPMQTDILELIQRARVRPDVLRHIEDARIFMTDDNKLEQSLAEYEQAALLDSSYTPANEGVARAKQAILERDFNRRMSAGFQAISNARLSEAKREFELALQLKPGNSASLEALQQVEANRIEDSRQRKLRNAERAENEERWADALAIYQELLKADASLTAAQLGQIRSRARFQLSQRVENVLDNPLALQSEPAWQDANSLLAELDALAKPGEKTVAQQTEMRKLLQTARTPVVVRLASDEQTRVEIYKVGKLGTFSEQAMNLFPGRYVIVGTRPGYRDVRHELKIDGSVPVIDLPVICTETI